MTCYIYTLHNEDVVWYVGQTTNPKRRLYEHKFENTTVSKNLDKDSYQMTIIDTCDPEYALETEGFYINFLEPVLNLKIYRGSHAEADRIWRESNPEKRKEVLHSYNTSEKHKEANRRWRLKRRANST
jgi:hypothetical protein